MIILYQISFHVCAKSIIKISWIRINTKAPMNPIYIHAEIKPKKFVYIECYEIRTISGKFKNQSQYMRWWPQDNTNLWQIRTQKWHNLSTLSIKYFHSRTFENENDYKFRKFLISGWKTCSLVKLYLFTYKLTNFLKNRVNLPKKFKQRGSAYSQKFDIFQQLLKCFMRGALSWMTLSGHSLK